MKGINLTVNVKPHIQKYIIQTVGSDTIRLERSRTLTYIILPHLSLVPADEADDETPEDYVPIHIELPCHSLTYEAATGRVYNCFPLYRDKITPEGQEKVRRFLGNTFKQSFRMFMDGYIADQIDMLSISDKERRLRVQEGIISFLLSYGIEPEELLVSSLRRDWYRHCDRTQKNRFSPLLY